MNKNTNNFMKGMGAGIAAGAVIMTAGKMVMSNKKSISKGANKAVKAVGDFVEGVQTFMK